MTKEDAVRHLASSGTKAPEPPAAAAAAPAAAPKAAAASSATATPKTASVPKVAPETFWHDEARGPFKDVPTTTMRKVIAQRLGESKQQVPHLYATIDTEIDAALNVRAQMKRIGTAPIPSMNDIIIKAVALALKETPKLNVRLSSDGSTVVQNATVDVSVAVATPGGLITPIVARADEKPLPGIAEEMKDLAARAKANKLKPAEFQGGSFSVSNLGMMGIDDFTAVINPPQSAILAIGSGMPQLLAPNGSKNAAEVRVGDARRATVMTVALSIDRRVANEADAGRFLSTFKALIESPVSLM